MTMYPKFVNRETLHTLCNCIEDTSLMTPVFRNRHSLRRKPPNILFMLRKLDNLP